VINEIKRTRKSVPFGALLAFTGPIVNKDKQIENLTARVAALEEQLRLRDELVSALLTKIYGAKSEKMSQDQMLLAFLEDTEKKPEAADIAPDAPAAKKRKKKKARTNKLLLSLNSLPTTTRIDHRSSSPRSPRRLSTH